MRSLFLTGFALIILLPVARAVEPMNPESSCERFIKPDEQAACMKRAQNMNLDWYAASLCNGLEADENLLECWKKVEGGTFSPVDLAKCETVGGDDERLSCLSKLKDANGLSKRKPASAKSPKRTGDATFQPLKVKTK